jgi:hypothetical protein
MLISKKPWVCTRHSFLQRTSPEHRGQLKNRSNQVFKPNGHPIPSCQFSTRCGRSSFCLYHIWYSKPLNGFIGYGLCADDADAFTRGGKHETEEEGDKKRFFPGWSFMTVSCFSSGWCIACGLDPFRAVLRGGGWIRVCRIFFCLLPMPGPF